MLLDDSILLVKAAEAAGVQTTFQVSHGLFHAWPVLGNVMPESKQALKETAAFIHKSMGILP